MHPDFSLVLQKCASNLSLKHKQPFLIKAFLNSKNMASSPNHRSENQEDLVRIVSDEEDEAAGDYREEGTEDNISLCSELSVGKENPAQERPSHMAEEEDEEEDEILDISDTHSNASSHNEAPNTPSPGINSADQGLNPFALAHNLRFPVPFALQNNNNSNPAANMSPFQEEFLRKSHLYAEELMKHQMQLMAAARASAFSLRSHHALPPQLQHSAQLSAAPSLVHHLNPLAKIGQLSAAAAAALSVAAQQQQQHKSLNHVPNPHVAAPHHMLSHHATNLNHQQYDTLAKLTDLTKQHSPSSPSHASSNTAHQMMSTLNQLQTQMQAHLPGLLHDNNDNLHERALKFSIDNILKADFGRSNSLDSPPQQRKNNHGKSHSQRHKLPNPSTCSSSASASSSLTSNILTDSLEHSMQSLSHNISPTTQTFSSSLATICTNSNDSSSTAVSSSYSSANGTVDLVKSSPSQTPTLSPGFSSSTENGGGNAGSHNKNAANKSEETASSTTTTSTSATGTGSGPIVWPAWVYCTRYSDRPSSGPRVRKPKAPKTNNSSANTAASTAASGENANSPSSSSSAGGAAAATAVNNNEDKRPRTAFSGSQLARLKHEFNENRYLTEKRRQQLSSELGLNEAQIKIWFQNKRAKLKKSSGVKNPLALQLMAQGLYNHSTIPLTREEEELQELQEREKNNNNNSNSLQQSQQQATSAVSS